MFKRLRETVEVIRWEDAAHASRWGRFARGQVRLYFYILRELIRNNCFQQAAALTYTTLLSLVPLLAVAFAFLRSFAPLEGIEKTVQGAIFQAVLAGPLLESRAEPLSAGDFTPAEAARVLQLSPQEALAEAQGRPRLSGVGLTFRLYLRALEDPGAASQARLGMSTLRLPAMGPPSSAFSAMGGRARENYLSAAGRPALAARRAVAEAEEAAAHDLAERGAFREAVEHYRAAVAGYCDALFLSAGEGAAGEMAGLAKAHEGALAALGDALFGLGKQEADLAEGLRRSGAAGEEVVAAALKHLSEAARLMEHSSEAHAALGDVHAAAGRQQEALQEYRVALAKSREVAARGISMAVVDYIRMFVDKVGRTEIGVLGGVLLLVAAVLLLNTIEKTVNRIWRVAERRPFWVKFTSFCTLIWLGPVLIGASLWVGERLGHYVSGVAAMGGLFHLLGEAGKAGMSFVATWLVLLALYRFLPNTRVRLKSAAWGAFVAGILVQAARPLFTVYVMNVVRYDRIYGSLSVIPIFLVWVWLLWVVVLLGAEVSFTIQNLNLLRYDDRLHRLSATFIDRFLAARIMMYVGREFQQTGRPVTAAQLGEMLQMTPQAAADAAGRLVNLGLLAPVGEDRDEFHPARDLSRLRLSELLGVTDRFRDDSRSTRPEDQAYEGRLDEAFRQAGEGQQDALRDMTFRDLLEQCERDRAKGSEPPATDPP